MGKIRRNNKTIRGNFENEITNKPEISYNCIMPSEQYLNYRRIATLNVETMGPKHPCQKGKGSCCERNSLMCTEDTELLLAAITQGLIAPDILKTSIVNIRSQKSNNCPFLSTQLRTCTIYQYRPLRCMIAGVCGTVSSQDVIDRAIAQIRMTSTDLGIDVAFLSNQLLCKSCFRIMNQRHDRMSTQTVIDSSDILIYLALQKRTSISDFVANRRSKRRRI